MLYSSILLQFCFSPKFHITRQVHTGDGHLVAFRSMGNFEVLFYISKIVFELLHTLGFLKSLWLMDLLLSGLYKYVKFNNLLEDIDFILLQLNSILQHLHSGHHISVGCCKKHFHLFIMMIIWEVTSSIRIEVVIVVYWETSNNTMRQLRTFYIQLRQSLVSPRAIYECSYINYHMAKLYLV